MFTPPGRAIEGRRQLIAKNVINAHCRGTKRGWLCLPPRFHSFYNTTNRLILLGRNAEITFILVLSNHHKINTIKSLPTLVWLRAAQSLGGIVNFTSELVYFITLMKETF